MPDAKTEAQAILPHEGDMGWLLAGFGPPSGCSGYPAAPAAEQPKPPLRRMNARAFGTPLEDLKDALSDDMSQTAGSCLLAIADFGQAALRMSSSCVFTCLPMSCCS